MIGRSNRAPAATSLEHRLEVVQLLHVLQRVPQTGVDERGSRGVRPGVKGEQTRRQFDPGAQFRLGLHHHCAQTFESGRLAPNH